MKRTADKIVTLDKLASQLAKARHAGKKIVHAHGVFDLLHLGHIRYLSSAKSLGGMLVVTLTADRFVKRGPGRPIFNENLRAEALAHLEVVDYVVVLHESTALPAIRAIKPHFYVKGPDYRGRAPEPSSRLKDEEAAVKKGGGRLVFTDDETYSSSELINRYIESHPAATVRFLKGVASKFDRDQIVQTFDRARGLRALVIGDTIIDQYCYTVPLGKSAKENIVAQKYLSTEDYAGGALATANHLAQLCESVDLVTVLGKEDSYQSFIEEHLDPRIRPTFFYRADAVTTRKRRYITEYDKKKTFEVVHLDDSPYSIEDERRILAHIKKKIRSYDIVIVSDFGHGMLSGNLIRLLEKHARFLAINVQSNSANMGFNLVTKYRRADLVCIDELEIRLATQDRFSPIGKLIPSIAKKMKVSSLAVTQGADGSITYYQQDKKFVASPAFASSGVDKVGAGDAFFAYTAPLIATGADRCLTAMMGNVVGALKIQIIGNKEPVRRADVIKFATRLLKI